MKLKPAPIIKMLGVTIIVVFTIILINTTISSLQYYENIIRDSSWILASLVHVPQFLIPFLLICYITKGRLGEYGFNLKETPPTFTHSRMFGIGALFGLFMSLKYIPQIIEKTPLDIPQPVTLVNIIGTMTFQWIIVGLCEETMFRGLIQTYLMNNLEGRVKITGHDFI